MKNFLKLLQLVIAFIFIINSLSAQTTNLSEVYTGPTNRCGGSNLFKYYKSCAQNGTYCDSIEFEKDYILKKCKANISPSPSPDDFLPPIKNQPVWVLKKDYQSKEVLPILDEGTVPIPKSYIIKWGIGWKGTNDRLDYFLHKYENTPSKGYTLAREIALGINTKKEQHEDKKPINITLKYSSIKREDKNARRNLELVEASNQTGSLFKYNGNTPKEDFEILIMSFGKENVWISSDLGQISFTKIPLGTNAQHIKLVKKLAILKYLSGRNGQFSIKSNNESTGRVVVSVTYKKITYLLGVDRYGTIYNPIKLDNEYGSTASIKLHKALNGQFLYPLNILFDQYIKGAFPPEITMCVQLGSKVSSKKNPAQIWDNGGARAYNGQYSSNVTFILSNGQILNKSNVFENIPLSLKWKISSFSDPYLFILAVLDPKMKILHTFYSEKIIVLINSDADNVYILKLNDGGKPTIAKLYTDLYDPIDKETNLEYLKNGIWNYRTLKNGVKNVINGLISSKR